MKKEWVTNDSEWVDGSNYYIDGQEVAIVDTHMDGSIHAIFLHMPFDPYGPIMRLQYDSVEEAEKDIEDYYESW